MRIKTTIKETNFTFCNQLNGSKKKKANSLQEAKVVFDDPEYGIITENRLDAGSFLISFLEFDLVRPVHFELQSNDKLMQMNFFLKGLDLHSLSHHIRKINKGTEVFEVPASSETIKSVSIFFPSEAFEALLNYMFWDNKMEFTEIQHTKIPQDFIKNTLALTPEMQTVLREMASCEKTGQYKRLYLENKITELLLLQLEQYELNESVQTQFSKSDIEKMNEARKLVIQNLASPCSLIDLAKKVGTNEFKLKKQFKALFGNTVFGYLNEIKMNKANQMLQKGDYNVSEVADKLGYKTPSHFVTAFKRYFGYSPGTVLRVSITIILNMFDFLVGLLSEELTLITAF
ncbi:helix-turn-helix transcriptional regulator [Flavobacterium agrisoli]|uniref:Helix-turn-helix transcriptional regulator n=1 Tax=Flavobacterium agrisoli TaxID=2793066 RepID=A0A934PP76_9FLAO|nr:AraC family transcriptional regulator [Flavobacterium agrisoli]MBK0370810.1 helix-turn-helix transcriptional regulator [Flavobacterium agrisoli]